MISVAKTQKTAVKRFYQPSHFYGWTSVWFVYLQKLSLVPHRILALQTERLCFSIIHRTDCSAENPITYPLMVTVSNAIVCFERKRYFVWQIAPCIMNLMCFSFHFLALDSFMFPYIWYQLNVESFFLNALHLDLIETAAAAPPPPKESISQTSWKDASRFFSCSILFVFFHRSHFDGSISCGVLCAEWKWPFDWSNSVQIWQNVTYYDFRMILKEIKAKFQCWHDLFWCFDAAGSPLHWIFWFDLWCVRA